MSRTLKRTVTIVTVTRSEIVWEAAPPAGPPPEPETAALPAPETRSATGESPAQEAADTQESKGD